METSISLNFNRIKKSIFVRYLNFDKSIKQKIDGTINSWIKKNPIPFSKNIKQEDKEYLKYMKYFSNILTSEKYEVVNNQNRIFTTIRRKYYKKFDNKYKLNFSAFINDVVVFIVVKNNNEYYYFDIVAREEYDNVVKGIDNDICCLTTYHALQKIMLRGCGSIVNHIVEKNFYLFEKRVCNYINTSEKIRQIYLKDEYRVVNLLNNNMEETSYYTDSKMVYVICDKVLITSYAYWPGRYKD